MLIPDTYLTVHEELLLFFGAVLLGCALEILFDLFRAFRLIIPHKTAATAIEDIIFILIWAGSVVCFTSVFAKGDLRIFYIIGNILGLILWRVTIGNPLVRLLSRLLHNILRLIKWLFSPITRLYVRTYKKCASKFVNNAKNHKRKKNPLIAVRKMLYNIFNTKGRKDEAEYGSEKKDKEA
jgi:hypothetical protein